MTPIRIVRTMRNHEWQTLQEWVNALDALAELDDAEIDALAALGRAETCDTEAGA